MIGLPIEELLIGGLMIDTIDANRESPIANRQS